MMNFPSSPTVGQTFKVGTRTWVWNGTVWTLGSSAAVPSSPWTKLLDSNPMTALTGFTAETGTWTPGVSGVNQTATSGDKWLRYNTDISTQYSFRAIQVSIKGSGGKLGVGFGYSTGAGWATGNTGIWLDFTNNTVAWDLQGTGGGSQAYALTPTSVEYVLKVVEVRRMGSTANNPPARFKVFVNGVFVKQFAVALANTEYVGLTCRDNGVGYFRNVSVWGADPIIMPE